MCSITNKTNFAESRTFHHFSGSFSSLYRFNLFYFILTGCDNQSLVIFTKRMYLMECHYNYIKRTNAWLSEHYHIILTLVRLWLTYTYRILAASEPLFWKNWKNQKERRVMCPSLSAISPWSPKKTTTVQCTLCDFRVFSVMRNWVWKDRECTAI